MKHATRLTWGQLSLAVYLWMSPTAQAQLELVTDINQTPSLAQSNPTQFTALGSSVVFAATSGAEGRELWVTNGTTGGTTLIKDVWPGNLGSDPLILGVVGSTLYFAANDGVHGRELWKTDGTSLGTVLVKDVFTGSQSGIPLSYNTQSTPSQWGIAHGGKLFFAAQDYDRNLELWTSDGTEAGTVMVRDLKFNTVNPGSNPTRFYSTGSLLFFLANTDSQGTELYKTDGTFAGTVLVKDITSGSSSGFYSRFVTMGGLIYFGANDGVNGVELWKSDGTTAGTAMVKNINPGAGNAGVSELIAVGSTLYLSAASSSSNNELWKSDGTDAGTVLVKEIQPSTAQFRGSDPFGFRAVGSTIYFFANDGTTGIELWKSDGTAGGTTLVKDILSGSGFGARVNDPGTAPPMMEVLGSNVYFYATDGTATGGELWKSDGTSGGTVMVKEIGVGAANAVVRELKAIGSLLYFSAVQPGGGTEPYVSDSSSAGTNVLKDISSATAASTPKHLVASGGKLFFSANDGVNGRELWVADGTGAHLTAAANTNASDTSIAAVGALNGTAFFGTSTTPNNSDYQLASSDGSAPGTSLVTAVPPLSAVPTLPGGESFRAVGNLIFFPGYTPEHGTELWRSDGTAAGTFMVKDLFPGPDDSEFQEMVSIGNVLYFVADDGAHGREVWRSDGTAAGTFILKDIDTSSGSDPFSLCAAGSTLYFSAYGPGGYELFKSNGTSAGTVLVKDVNANGSSFASNITALNPTTVLFTAFEQATGTELYKSNGTAAGTVLVKDIRPGSQSSSPSALTERGPDMFGFGVMGGSAYFSADDGVNGRELWKSDGTAAGTVMVKDIMPGATGSDPDWLVVVNDKIYFVVTISGSTQLWTSDGTTAGTVMVDDQMGALSSLTVSGTTLYMVGSTSSVETELFRMANVRTAPFSITQSPSAQNLNVGAALSLSVSTAGPAPTYQWRKNGIAIPGATKATYALSKVTEANQGSYDVLLRSGDFELLSGAAQVDVTDPAKIAITQQPLAKLAATGTSAAFSVSVVGQSPSFQWFKGTVAISGANSSTLTIPSVQTSDAGLYKVRVSNSLGTVFSSAVQLAVVISTDQFVPVKLNTTASLAAPAIGTGLTYRWLYNGSPLTAGDFSGRVSGFSTSKLGIAKFTTSDQSDFPCLISLGGQSIISGKMQPRVAAIPIITPVAMPAPWIISGAVNQLATTLFTQSNLTGASWNAPTSFIITGLPKGLAYDAKTGLITGRPQSGGGTNVTLTIKVGNVAGITTAAINVTVPVEAFPALASGAFRGLADRSATTLNDNLGNFVQADVSSIGSFSGKLFRGTTAYSFVTRYVDTVPGSTTATANVSIPRAGSTALTLLLTLDGSTGVLSGTLTDGTNSTPFTCIRNPWLITGTTPNPATAYAKAYTAALQLQPAQVNDPLYEQGDGYAVANVTTAGVVSGAVRVADGTKATFSTLLGPLGEIPLHTGYYSNTGSFHGWSQITSSSGNWDGTDTFYKAPQPLASTTRSYKGGIPLHTLTLVGSPWSKPSPSALLLSVSDSGAPTAANNAEIKFTQGGISSSNLAVAGLFDPDLRIKAPASTFVMPSPNPGKLSLSFASLTTGEITGSFSTTDPNPVLSGKTVTRTATYYGVIVQRLNRGRGHFNLAKLPDALQSNPLKTEVLSGLIELKTL